MGGPESRKTVRVGIYLPRDAQVLDLACVDIFGTMSYEYLSPQKDMVPAVLYNLAPSVQFFYIGKVQPGELIPLTSGSKLMCTHHMSDPEVQPGKLDILCVPGPDPRNTWDDSSELEWLAAHAARQDTDILCICTAIFLCGAAGILKGKKACAPRGLQQKLKGMFEGVTWLGDSLRWNQDGNFWSCGGITNANDLVSAYARQSPLFPGPVAEFGLALTETGDRPQVYTTGKTVFTLGIVWQLVKAVFLSLGKKSKTA
ncbi:ThiJ/PfpI family protein [Lasiosphaeria ovina]|uniref:ThiJ/PfpI family protein n=1 Tax=Lasiosphaeria ovina TaxID=92902 RepID=A0AAE0NK13_9PEZI|nr:ThiJ/PfpI family protein [Lasiosphaeria ovina]